MTKNYSAQPQNCDHRPQGHLAPDAPAEPALIYFFISYVITRTQRRREHLGTRLLENGYLIAFCHIRLEKHRKSAIFGLETC